MSASGANLQSKSRELAGYKVLPWTGDDYTLGHRLRDGNVPAPPDKAEKTVDFVIVGGGIAGLATSYYLRDQNFVLLEQYGQTGGTSSGGNYRGIEYSRGAVCTSGTAGLKGQLFEQLNIKPVIIPPTETAWHEGGHWLKSVNGTDRFHQEWNRLLSEIDKHEKNDGDKLEELSFANYLSSYDKSFLGLIENLTKTFYCASAENVTANAGFFIIKTLTSDSYVFDGGNSAICRAITKAIDSSSNERIHTQSFVWSVEPSSQGASVVYSDAAGAVHRIDCKHVIVTTPPYVALRIVSHLPETLRSLWNQIEYGAFVVINCCMPKKVLQYPYQSFADEPYPFCQMAMAEAPYQLSGRYKPEMGSVLTVYHPYASGPAARHEVLTLNADQFANSMVAQLSQLFEPLQNNLEQIEITRWGHAIMVPKPGLSSVLNKANQVTSDWMTFAHSSAGGGQSLEGALAAARNAADRCLKVSVKVRT